MPRAQRYMRGLSSAAGPLVVLSALAISTSTLSAQRAAAPAPRVLNTAQGEWPSYTGDTRGSRYAPLDQITAANFGTLEVAWRLKTDAFGPRPEFKLEGTPLMVGGMLYTTAGTRRAVIALDAATGELKWMYSLDEGARGAAAPRPLSGRGLAYWTDGTSSRILYTTPGYRLIALDAKTGALVPGFGEKGIVDLKADIDQQILPDLETGEIGFQGAPVVARDVIIIGAAFREGGTPRSMRNNKGYIRGFDVRTGKRLWTFHTIPKKGEPGYDTWLDGSAEVAGNTGMWTQLTVDEELGIVYLPIESPTGDYYGGHRPGNNLYGESLVAVDLRTGVKKWHYQIVRHPIWDFDLSAAPILADITVEGKAIKAVALPTKQGLLYVFDRVTGVPVWPFEEMPVEKGDVPGEWYAPTQPMPTKPKAYSRNGVLESDLIDFTPALKEAGLTAAQRFKLGPIFTPPIVSDPNGKAGVLTNGPTNGGTNWPGGSYDPETRILYLSASNFSPFLLGVIPPPAGTSDMRYVRGAALAPGAPRLSFSVQGLPILKPPYGTITAIDMDKGEILWQVPHGDTPDYVKNNQALTGIEIPRTGQPGSVGTLVTKTLIIAGDPEFTSTPTRPRSALLRAYDKASGREVGAVTIPAPQSGSPMTYMLNGRQYIVVAVSGGNYSGEYVAFRLPVAGGR